MVITVSAALCSATAERVSVERTSGGQYINGIYKRGVTTTFKTICSVQQPNDIELQNLPIGERDKDARVFISKKQLLTSRDRNKTVADVVVYKTLKYKIIKSADWNVYGYNKAIGVRME